MTSPNRDALVRLARLLGPLADELVFVGGRVADLLVTDPVGLRARGFVEDARPRAPVCRWRAGDELLDVMPVEGAVFGFGNAWFAHAVRLNGRFELEPQVSIRVVAAPVFLATKWEAHNDRGGEAWCGDADIEDVIAGSLPDARDVPGLLDRVGWRFEAIARSEP